MSEENVEALNLLRIREHALVFQRGREPFRGSRFLGIGGKMFSTVEHKWSFCGSAMRII
jgi:hypothetical protein